MGSLGFPELMIILVIALVLFGGGKLPEAGRAIGQAIREFKNSMRDTSAEVKDVKKEIEKDIKA